MGNSTETKFTESFQRQENITPPREIQSIDQHTQALVENKLYSDVHENLSAPFKPTQVSCDDNGMPLDRVNRNVLHMYSSPKNNSGHSGVERNNIQGSGRSCTLSPWSMYGSKNSSPDLSSLVTNGSGSHSVAENKTDDRKGSFNTGAIENNTESQLVDSSITKFPKGQWCHGNSKNVKDIENVQVENHFTPKVGKTGENSGMLNIESGSSRQRNVSQILNLLGKRPNSVSTNKPVDNPLSRNNSGGTTQPVNQCTNIGESNHESKPFPDVKPDCMQSSELRDGKSQFRTTMNKEELLGMNHARDKKCLLECEFTDCTREISVKASHRSMSVQESESMSENVAEEDQFNFNISFSPLAQEMNLSDDELQCSDKKSVSGNKQSAVEDRTQEENCNESYQPVSSIGGERSKTEDSACDHTNENMKACENNSKHNVEAIEQIIGNGRKKISSAGRSIVERYNGDAVSVEIRTKSSELFVDIKKIQKDITPQADPNEMLVSPLVRNVIAEIPLNHIVPANGSFENSDNIFNVQQNTVDRLVEEENTRGLEVEDENNCSLPELMSAATSDSHEKGSDCLGESTDANRNCQDVGIFECNGINVSKQNNSNETNEPLDVHSSSKLEDQSDIVNNITDDVCQKQIILPEASIKPISSEHNVNDIGSSTGWTSQSQDTMEFSCDTLDNDSHFALRKENFLPHQIQTAETAVGTKSRDLCKDDVLENALSQSMSDDTVKVDTKVLTDGGDFVWGNSTDMLSQQSVSSYTSQNDRTVSLQCNYKTTPRGNSREGVIIDHHVTCGNPLAERGRLKSSMCAGGWVKQEIIFCHDEDIGSFQAPKLCVPRVLMGSVEEDPLSKPYGFNQSHCQGSKFLSLKSCSYMLHL